MEWLLNDAQTRSKVITLDSSGWVAQEMVKDEETAGWVVKIVRGDDEDMESSTLAVSKDRVGMWGKIKSILERVVRDTAEWPTDVNGNQDDQFPCHYLLAGYVFLTSTQLNQCSWLNLSAKTDRDFLVFKGNMWGQRFGNAKRIAQTPESYFNHPIDDSNEVLQMEIK